MHVSTSRRLSLLSAAFALAAACSAPSAATGSAGAGRDAGTASRAAVLDDTLHVQLGRSATTDRGRLALTFLARLSDSRCPADVVCVWMGDAAVRIAARVGGTSVERELHTGLEPHSLSVDRYTVTVVGLLPYPGTESAGAPTATPTVVLRVVRE
ncbi:MAG: hypothetical protein ABR499_15165 [Gemmatimonadaceae bacterium]